MAIIYKSPYSIVVVVGRPPQRQFHFTARPPRVTDFRTSFFMIADLITSLHDFFFKVPSAIHLGAQPSDNLTMLDGGLSI